MYHSVAMKKRKRDGCENRKKYKDGARLNPKRYEQWAISSQASNRGRFNDYLKSESTPQATGGGSGRHPYLTYDSYDIG